MPKEKKGDDDGDLSPRPLSPVDGSLPEVTFEPQRRCHFKILLLAARKQAENETET